MTLIALQFLRSIRQEQSVETTVATVVQKVDQVEGMLHHLSEGLTPPEVILLGPHYLRPESERFSRNARGGNAVVSCVSADVPYPCLI